MRELRPFSPNESGIQVFASIAVSDGELLLDFVVKDPHGRLRDGLVPSAHSTFTRADGLWQTTCLEAFWGTPGQPEYFELNLSPKAAQWNLYAFDGYRQPQPPRPSSTYDLVSVEVGDDRLRARLRGPVEALEVRLCAVIRTDSGVAYYSTSHSGTKPDFHSRADFTLRVPQDFEGWLAEVGQRFSPADRIELGRIAQAKRLKLAAEGNANVLAALQRDFAENNQWGFEPMIVAASPGSAMGVSFILFVFVLFTFGLMSVTWLGQNYASSGEGKDLVLLLSAISVVVITTVAFLARASSRQRES